MPLGLNRTYIQLCYRFVILVVVFLFYTACLVLLFHRTHQGFPNTRKRDHFAYLLNSLVTISLFLKKKDIDRKLGVQSCQLFFLTWSVLSNLVFSPKLSETSEPDLASSILSSAEVYEALGLVRHHCCH